MGHGMALLSVAVWGTTFISTKILLQDFAAIEIAIYRFVLAILFLNIIVPQRLKLQNKKHTLLFMAAGLSGITLYFLTENLALTFTTATNVGVIISTVPFFTGLIGWVFFGERKPTFRFVIGFFVAMAGVVLISYNGATELQLNPMGDLLTLAAVITWAFYSNIMCKIGEYGYRAIQVTRRVFVYGFLFLLPAVLIFPFEFQIERFLNPIYAMNFVFLGIGASAICFVTWNVAISRIGTIKTSNYLYLSPVVTMVVSAIVLREPMSYATFIGAILTICGLVLINKRIGIKEKA